MPKRENKSLNTMGMVIDTFGYTKNGDTDTRNRGTGWYQQWIACTYKQAKGLTGRPVKKVSCPRSDGTIPGCKRREFAKKETISVQGCKGRTTGG